MSLKLYVDLVSQPARALYIFLKLNKIPFELCQVALRKGEHLTDEFKEKYNRFGRVPFIHDGDFKLAESVAIVRYLAKKHNLDNNWYPKDPKAQAKVDEYLEWQHLNTRNLCATYFQRKWLLPLITGKKFSPESIEKAKTAMLTCLDDIENIWLAKTPFIAGDNVSVADVFAACELEQPRIAGFDFKEGRPVLSAWFEKVRNQANPCYDEANAIINKLAQKASSGEAKL